MKSFKVAVEWAMMDEIEVMAEDLDDAKEKVMDMRLTQGSYIDGSFQVNDEVTEQLNEEE